MLFLLILSAFGLQDFLSTSDMSELILEGHSGLKLSTGSATCFLGVFNNSIQFGFSCDSYYPLYIDSNRRTHIGADLLTEADISFKQSLTINQVDQWALIHFDAFETTEAEGWSNNTITECAGVRMLGGYCQFSAGNTWKEFTQLPAHTQIRIQGVWHFIDEWRGETAVIEVGDEKNTDIVWSFTYDITSSKAPQNFCGNEAIGEGKFAVPFDIVVDNSEDKVLVVFGSTLELQPCKKSWGVSGLEVFIR